MRRILISLIRFYQIVFSPLMGKRCRFYPSCSTFMIEAIDKIGPLKGTLLGIRRILRCHPFNAGGYDPVEKWIR